MSPQFNSPETPMSQHEQSHYAQAQEYTAGPALPQISTLTPFCYSDDSMNKRESIRATSHDYKEGDFVCPRFFQIVNPARFVFEFLPQDWRYDMRRTAQSILPFLYLGPLGSIRDRDYLRQEGITLLLAVRNDRSVQARLVSGEKPATELGIEADFVDVASNQELISIFPRAIRRINDHIASQDNSRLPAHTPKKALVFCESGNERSAAVVITYMMTMFNLSASMGMRILQSRRFSVTIQDSLRLLLESFESILKAKRDIEKVGRAAIASPNLPSPVTAPQKRNLADSRFGEVSEDSMMDMDESEEWNGRRPMAPFQDRS